MNHDSSTDSSVCCGTMLSMTKWLALRVEADGEPVERDLPHGLAHAVDVIGVVGDLVVGDEEEALVLVLQAHPVLERARIVPEVRATRSAGCR